MRKSYIIFALFLGLAISMAASADSVYSVFKPTNVHGARNPDLLGSACVEVSLHSTTADGGYIDFALTNTSPRLEMEPGQFGNAFITEFRFDLPDGYDLDKNDSSIIAAIGVCFSNGHDDPVIVTDVERTLDWDYGNANGANPSLRRDFMADLGNGSKNVIFSHNALNEAGVPVDNCEEGFLCEAYDGAVFDTIIFRVKVKGGDASLTEDDLLMYGCGHLTVKFQGGEGSIRVGNSCAQSVVTPEPQTIIMIGAGLTGLAAVLRRRMK